MSFKSAKNTVDLLFSPRGYWYVLLALITGPVLALLIIYLIIREFDKWMENHGEHKD